MCFLFLFPILCILCFCIVLCIVSLFVYSCLFPIFVHIYRPLLPGGNPIAVNIYIYIYIRPADRARWLTQSRYFLTSIRKDSPEDRFLHIFLVSGWQLTYQTMLYQIRPWYCTWNHVRVPHIRSWTCALWSLPTNTPFAVIRTFHATICNRGSVFKRTTHNGMTAAVSYGSA